MPDGLRKGAIRGAASLLPFKARRYRGVLEVLALGNQVERYASWQGAFDTSLLPELLDPASADRCARRASSPRVEQELARCDSDGRLERLLWSDFHLRLADDMLVKGDRMSMGASVEARVPFLDHVLVEYASGLPAHYKVRGLKTKVLLKKLAERYVPMENIYRPKVGFTVPLSDWFLGPLRGFLRDTLLDDRCLSRGYFVPDVLKRVVEEHLDRKVYREQGIWALLSLEIWHRLFVDDDGSQAACERLQERIRASLPPRRPSPEGGRARERPEHPQALAAGGARRLGDTPRVPGVCPDSRADAGGRLRPALGLARARGAGGGRDRSPAGGAAFRPRRRAGPRAAGGRAPQPPARRRRLAGGARRGHAAARQAPARGARRQRPGAAVARTSLGVAAVAWWEARRGRVAAPLLDARPDRGRGRGRRVLLAMAIEAQPLAFTATPLSSDDKRRVYRLLKGRNPRKIPPGETRTLELTGHDLDVLLAWGLPVVLGQEAKGQRGARTVRGRDRRGLAAAALPWRGHALPQPRGGARASASSAVPSTCGTPGCASAAWRSRPAAARAHAGRARAVVTDRRVRPLLRSVQELRVDRDRVSTPTRAWSCLRG
jgi:hypothetical protein